MREKQIEQKLSKEIKCRNGICLKLACTGLDGVPDRLALLPDGKCAFAEIKAPGRKMRPLQIKRKRQLEELGFKVYCIDRPEMIGGIIDEIQSS